MGAGLRVDGAGGCDGVELIRVVERRRLGSPGAAQVVMRRDGVEELGPRVALEPAGALLDHAQAEVDVSEQAPLVRLGEERTEVEFPNSADVVQERRRDEQVAPQPWVHGGGVPAESRHGDRVLEQPSRVAVVAVGRRRKRPQPFADLGIAHEASDERTQLPVGELLGQELEEAVELVEIAPCGRGEARRVGVGLLERAHIELEAIPEALDPAQHPDRVALLEPAVEDLDVTPHASVDPAARIDELEREVRGAGPRPEPPLARDGEGALHDPVLLELRNRHGEVHSGSLGGRRDARLATIVDTPLVKPFRALRFDPETAGPLDDLVAPPYDVIPRGGLVHYSERSPNNVVRLIRPHEPELAAERLREWTRTGILMREARPAIWRIEESFTGPDGVPRTRHGLVARARLEPYERGVVLPHERIFAAATASRLRLLRATRTKLSPVLLLHDGAPAPLVERSPDIETELDGTTTRLWRIDDPDAVEAAAATVVSPFVIADGHHRYDAALRFHEEQRTDETGWVLAVLVSRQDPGLTIFPTHRLVSGAVPELNGEFRVSPVSGSPGEALERLELVPRDRPGFVVVRPGEVSLVEGAAPASEPLERLDVTAVDRLPLEGVTYTPSLREAEAAIGDGRARAAFLVRAPTVAEVQAIARAGQTMPEKSTYFYPKLVSGLLFSPLDE